MRSAGEAGQVSCGAGSPGWSQADKWRSTIEEAVTAANSEVGGILDSVLLGTVGDASCESGPW